MIGFARDFIIILVVGAFVGFFASEVAAHFSSSLDTRVFVAAFVASMITSAGVGILTTRYLFKKDGH